MLKIIEDRLVADWREINRHAASIKLAKIAGTLVTVVLMFPAFFLAPLDYLPDFIQLPVSVMGGVAVYAIATFFRLKDQGLAKKPGDAAEAGDADQ